MTSFWMKSKADNTLYSSISMYRFAGEVLGDE